MEVFLIGAQCDFVKRAAVDKFEHCARQAFASKSPQVVNVDCVHLVMLGRFADTNFCLSTVAYPPVTLSIALVPGNAIRIFERSRLQPQSTRVVSLSRALRVFTKKNGRIESARPHEIL